MFPYSFFFDEDEEFLIDDEEEQDIALMIHRRRRGESSGGRRRSNISRSVVPRDHGQGEQLILKHYFGPNPVYPPHKFRRR